jgi:hypothetical protein
VVVGLRTQVSQKTVKGNNSQSSIPWVWAILWIKITLHDGSCMHGYITHLSKRKPDRTWDLKSQRSGGKQNSPKLLPALLSNTMHPAPQLSECREGRLGNVISHCQCHHYYSSS